jgi:hypothetical protein
MITTFIVDVHETVGGYGATVYNPTDGLGMPISDGLGTTFHDAVKAAFSAIELPLDE